MTLDIIEAPFLPPIYHCGPPLSSGALPSVFYFSLSGNESLSLDPYNQPAVYLAKHGIRVFSLTLPGHEGAHPHLGALESWAHSIISGKNVIQDFAEVCCRSIDFLLSSGYLLENKIAVAGLSRGAFTAAQLAALDNRVNLLLGFSPLTTLDHFIQMDHVACPELSSQYIVDNLADKTVRYYIGNRDVRVGTNHCFTFIQSLVEASYAKKHRSPPIEMIVFPSIGHKGHGTPPNIFLEGAEWLKQTLTS